MTKQTNKTTLRRIAHKMMNGISFQNGKEGEDRYENFTAKDLLTAVCVMVSIMFFVVLPKSLHAQDTTGMFSVNENESQDFTYAMMGPSNTIAVIDLDSRKIIDSVAVTGNPHGGALTPDGKYIYASSMGSEWVSVVDTRAKEVIKKIEVGAASHHAAVRADGRYVYVAADRLIVIDTATNEITARIKTTEQPFYPVLAPDGGKLYALNNGTTISVIDTETHEQIDTIEMGAKSMMGHLAVAPDGNTLYATNDMADRLSIFDTETGELRATVPVGKQPHAVAVSEDGRYVFVSNREETNISVIDAETAEVIANPELGGYPEHLSMTPDGNYLLAGLKDRFQKEDSGQSSSRDMTAAITIIDPNSLNIVEEMPAWPQVHDILVSQGK